MSDRIDELGHRTDVVLVTFTDPTKLAAYRQANDLPLPILIDHRREAYRAFGLGRGSRRRIYGIQATRRYLELFRDGWQERPRAAAGQRRLPDAGWFRELLRPSEDTLQLGGDFLVDAEGRLAYGFWGQGPDDRPTVDELITAARHASIDPEPG